jgi:hypothetical protein
MDVVDLVRPDVTNCISVELFVTKCKRFIANRELMKAPDCVQLTMSVDAFQAFASALEGKTVDITEGNYAGLSQLCDESCFADLKPQLSMFEPSTEFVDTEARDHILALEEWRRQSERPLAELRSKSSRQMENKERTIAMLRRIGVDVATLKDTIAAQATLPARVDQAEVDFA